MVIKLAPTMVVRPDGSLTRGVITATILVMGEANFLLLGFPVHVRGYESTAEQPGAADRADVVSEGRDGPLSLFAFVLSLSMR